MSTWRINRVFTIHSFKPNAYHFFFLAPVVFSNISTFILTKEILPIIYTTISKWIIYALPLQNEDQYV